MAFNSSDAMDHVFGYTCVNDVTARDVQKRHQQWYLGKSFDGFCPMGPWIVPKDALPEGFDPKRGLPIGTTVNGVRRQRGKTSDMMFDIPHLIATASRCMTLSVGDVIATGTPAGVPVAMTSPTDSVMHRLAVAIKCGMSNIMSDVLPRCRRTPFTVVPIGSPRFGSKPSGSASFGTIHGPMGQNPSNDFPRYHCWCRFWTSRAVTSLTQVYPKT